MSVQRVVVVGASAGGIRALEALVAGVPAGFTAPMIVALHLAAGHKPLLPLVLNCAGALAAATAEDGERLRNGRIYVAPPDRHLMIHRENLRVTRGARQNPFRPSIDALFQSAAYYFGSRTIAIILSGALSDGSRGLYAIKRLGGLAAVQHPDDATHSSMPLSAMRRVGVDYALPAAEIGPLLAELVQRAPSDEPADAHSYRIELESNMDIAAA